MLRKKKSIPYSLVLVILITFFALPSTSLAQQFQRVEGTNYFLVLFPNGDTSLGLKVDGEIQLVDEEEALSTLKKRVVTDKKLTKAFNALLRGKAIKVPNSKIFKTVRKLAKDSRDGLSGAKLRKVLATKNRVSNRQKINQRAINQIKKFFEEKVLPPIDTFRDSFTYTYTEGSTQKWIYAVYVGFTLPHKYRKTTSAAICASFSGDPEEPHLGAELPLESEETITNDPCKGATLFGDVSCVGFLGEGILAKVLSSTSGTGSGPTDTQVQSVLANAGSNLHQFRYKKGKTKCVLQ